MQNIILNVKNYFKEKYQPKEWKKSADGI
jgi:hypothetical protein